MATSDQRKSVLGIVNEVQRRLGVSTTSTLTATTQATLLLDFLNDIIDECSDFGDWQEMYREVEVTGAANTGEYKIDVSGSAEVKNVYEVVWDDDIAPLEVREIQDIRRLQRLNSTGTPRQYAMVGVSGVNPKFRVYPVPGAAAIAAASSATFDVAYYMKPRLYTTSDADTTPEFPARVLIQGVYAKALKEEAGGEPTTEYQAALAEYQRMRREALNRFNADTGNTMYIVPTGSRYL